MPTYISLMNFTEQGIKSIKDSPSRIDAARALVASHGGDFKAIYLTMGAYDAVAICELPDDEAAAKVALTVGGGGNVRTVTMRAFDEGEYRAMVAGLS